MKKTMSIILIVGVLGVLFSFSSVSAGGLQPLMQTTPFPTPTPGPDGRILYIVQEGDTLWDISAISGVDINELRSLNNLEASDVVIPGQILILAIQEQQGDGTEDGVVDPELTPEATLETGTGTICILLYEDENGDSFRQELETAIVDGAVSVTEKFGLFSDSVTTEAGYDPVCFEDIPEGEYSISVALPENYNPTTFMTASLTLFAGDTSYINFGGQTSGVELVEEPESSGIDTNLLMVIGGIILVLVGAGLGAYTLLRGRRVDIPKM